MKLLLQIFMGCHSFSFYEQQRPVDINTHSLIMVSTGISSEGLRCQDEEKNQGKKKSFDFVAVSSYEQLDLNAPEQETIIYTPRSSIYPRGLLIGLFTSMVRMQTTLLPNQLFDVRNIQ